MPENLQEYQEACCRSRQSLKAQGAFLIIVNGPKGTAFSTCFNRELEWGNRAEFVKALRDLADQIDTGSAAGSTGGIAADPKYHMCPPINA